MLSQLDLFASSRACCSAIPIDDAPSSDLPQVLAAIRETGCLTAMDSAGDGGRWTRSRAILPHLDFYVPNETEAANQTGRSERVHDPGVSDAGPGAGFGISWVHMALS